jgi:type I restriction enzyme R subunit
VDPEEKARLEIDRKLEDAGWKVIDREDFSPSVTALSVSEGLLKGHKEADYLLFLEGKAIGVLEAKKADTRLSDVVAAQAEDYTYQLLDWYQSGSNVVISTMQRLFATLNGQEFEDEDKVTKVASYTGESKNIVMEAQTNYGNMELDRSVVNPTQIRLVLNTFLITFGRFEKRVKSNTSLYLKNQKKQ